VSIHILVFIVGLFIVPIALLVVAHKLRRRSPRTRTAFWGAILGHIVAAIVATTWGMIPAETLTPQETARGAASLWTLLAFPLAGAAIGWIKPQSGRAALLLAPMLLLSSGAETLVPLIGHWSRGEDGGPTLTVDGEKWSGATTRAEVEGRTRPLWAVNSETFLTHATAADAFPLAVASDVSGFSSGTVRVQFKMLGGKSDQNAGIVFGLVPSDLDYYFVRYNTKDGDVALWRYSDGKRAVIAHGEPAKAKLPMNVWHTLTLQVEGSRVTVAANDSIALTHELPGAVFGRVGLWTKRDAITAFRNFVADKKTR
jgi:hypothetical protein